METSAVFQLYEKSVDKYSFFYDHLSKTVIVQLTDSFAKLLHIVQRNYLKKKKGLGTITKHCP